MSKINNYFDLGDFVYLVHDPEQVKMMVVEITIHFDGVLYTLASGANIIKCHHKELTKQKKVC